MWVYLFRHGPAGERDAERWPDDDRRPLTARGERRTRRAAQVLGGMERRPVQILTSPLDRAAQTAAMIAESMMTSGPVGVAEELAPGHSLQALLTRMQRANAEALVLVGHEPDLGRFAGLLLFGDAERAVPLKKAGCCALVFEGPPRAGTAQLRWLWTPRMLRLAAVKAIRA